VLASLDPGTPHAALTWPPTHGRPEFLLANSQATSQGKKLPVAAAKLQLRVSYDSDQPHTDPRSYDLSYESQFRGTRGNRNKRVRIFSM